VFLATLVTTLMASTAASSEPAISGRADPSLWPAIEWPMQDDPAVIKRVDALLASLSLEQKVGQLVQSVGR